MIVRWTVTAFYALAVLFVSTSSFGGTPPFPHFDKLVHFVMYAGLGFLCAWSLQAIARLPRRRSALFAVLMATAYGMVMEVVQYFLPTRSMESADVLANAIGAVAGAFLAMLAGKGVSMIALRKEGSAR